MESFRWLSVVLSIILGLGVTRLLSGFVLVFRMRRTVAVDWVTLLWGASVFFSQLSLWWSLYEVPGAMAHWNFAVFMAFVSLPTMLYLSAALLLPVEDIKPGHSQRDYFEQDGRWALPPLAVFNIVAIVLNMIVFGASPLSAWGAAAMLGAALALLAFFVRTRAASAAIALAYAAVFVLDIALVLDPY